VPIPSSEAELVELFRDLGAAAPEQWARSQALEGIPQVLRFLFLKGAWESIPREDDSKWIDRAIARTKVHSMEPYAGLGLALERCRERGVSDRDLNEIARCLQAQMLFSIGYLLNGPVDVPERLEDVSWGLFQIDDEGKPIGRRISGLHESVLAFDPTGREMRPRNDG